MSKHKFIEHTADIRVKIWGATREEVFENALVALARAMKEEPSQKINFCEEVVVESADGVTLLADFLSEALSLSSIKGVIFEKLKIKILEEKNLSGEICGYRTDKFDDDIKAITYHGLRLEEKEGYWEGEVIFDI